MFLWNEKAIQIVAGPCSVESEEQLFATARGLKKIGIQTLRGGIWKPRSRLIISKGWENQACGGYNRYSRN